MREIGIVQNIFGEYADVAIVRKTACGENCVSCKGGCVPSEQIVRAKNAARAKPGDRVAVEMESQQVVKAAFLAYLLPIVFLVAGTIIGQEVFGSEWPGIVTGISCMAVCLLAIHFIDRRKQKDFELTVTEILRGAGTMAADVGNTDIS